MDNAALVGLVVGQTVPLICQFGAAAIGGCGNGGFALAALDNFDGDMADSDNTHLFSVKGFRLRGTEQMRSGCLALRITLGSPRKPSEAVFVGSGGARERVQFSPQGGNGTKHTLRRRGVWGA